MPADRNPASSPLIVVTCDSHIGPTLAQMRPYCPANYLADYDAFAEKTAVAFDIWADIRASLAELDDPEEVAVRERQLSRNLQTEGHNDMDARRRDMDVDGIAADVIYHSSQNGELIPFIQGGSLWFNPTGGDLERAAVGLQIYNDWLADACSTAPDRHLGVAHLPTWDVEASVAEVERVRAKGLRAINLPTVRPGIPIYDRPDWEPFWETCESLGVTLNTHVGGAGGEMEFFGPQSWGVHLLERSGWMSRRALPRMLFAGVFERHPNLRYILTEQNGDWWVSTMKEYDSVYETYHWQFKKQMPKPPSEYCSTNVFIGASYMAPFEAHMAVEGGYTDNVMWGSDYPHAEGTYQYPDSADEENTTRLALRYACSDIPGVAVRAMVGENAVRCYGFNRDRLQAIADRISAPTPQEIGEPVEEVPEWKGIFSFRKIGAWG
jgi:predicted TIM-barrel fold metal-dependent hydrolase